MVEILRMDDCWLVKNIVKLVDESAKMILFYF